MFDFILVYFMLQLKCSLVPNGINNILICFILLHMEYFQNNNAFTIINNKILECSLRLLCNSFCH